MRTTVVIENQLFREAKKRSVEAGISFSEMVNRSLRETLSRKVEAARPFAMVTFGSPGEEESLTPSDFYDEIERDDGKDYADQRRQRR